MTATPSVSVIVPCYKQAHYLPEALRRSLGQRDVPLEIIVVDDGSPDDVKGACAEFESQVKYIRQENRGLSGARNTGIAAAQGKYVHFLDADDWVSEDFYRTLVPQLEDHPDWAVAACPSVLFLEATACEGPVTTPPGTGCPFAELAKSNRYTVGSVLVRRTALQQAGPFDEELSGCQDWDLWLRIARTGALFGRVDGPRFFYRIHPAGMSRHAQTMLDEAEEVLKRARAPDPRVTRPAPEWEKGVPSDDFEHCYGMVVARCAGKAMSTGDPETAIRLMERLIDLQRGAGLAMEHYRQMLAEIAIGCGSPSLDDVGVRRHCWDLVRTMDRLLPEDAPLRKALPDLVHGLFGGLLVRMERDLWRENYRRLASSFPIRELLWLRRRLLGVADAGEERSP